MLWTTLVFAMGAALLVLRQARRAHASHGQQAPQGAEATACPRCGSPVPPGAFVCPRCAVPLSVYELVGAQRVADAGGDPGAGECEAKKHAIVRADLCVGCGVCVTVCPVPGAITMRGKLAAVDLALCDGHARCAEACPTQGIVISTGSGVHRVEVPSVDVDFQSNVPGVFIVGELGGRGLIKNAINEGRVAIEHITRLLPPGAPRSDHDPDAFDVAIVGSGPAGLSAALAAHGAGLRYVVLEQGTLADTVQRYPRHKLLLAEPVTIPLYGDLWIADASKETLITVWRNIVERTGLLVRTHHRVVDVARERDFLRVDTSGGSFRARKVVLAMGRRGTPRRLEVPGEDLPKVVYDVAEMSAFAGRRVLVVGGGDSAVESVLGLANQPGTTVTLSYRGAEFTRVKERNLHKLADAAVRGRIEIRMQSEVHAIGPESIDLWVNGKREPLPNDDVIVRIGGEPPYPLLQRIGIEMIRKDVPLVSVD